MKREGRGESYIGKLTKYKENFVFDFSNSIGCHKIYHTGVGLRS